MEQIKDKNERRKYTKLQNWFLKNCKSNRPRGVMKARIANLPLDRSKLVWKTETIWHFGDTDVSCFVNTLQQFSNHHICVRNLDVFFPQMCFVDFSRIMKKACDKVHLNIGFFK